jgi:hypothetical protein
MVHRQGSLQAVPSQRSVCEWTERLPWLPNPLPVPLLNHLEHVRALKKSR